MLASVGHLRTEIRLLAPAMRYQLLEALSCGKCGVAPEGHELLSDLSSLIEPWLMAHPSLKILRHRLSLVILGLR